MALTKEQIAQRIARELQDGYYVNLGIGIPTLVANYIPAGINVVLQSENGLLGMGPFPFEGEEDPDLINAGKQTITTVPGSVFFDSAMSFGMIRAGKVDLIPQGTLATRCLAAGYGMPAVFTPAGVGTEVANGKESRVFNGKEYLMEMAFDAGFAIVKAWKGDTEGNLVYK